MSIPNFPDAVTFWHGPTRWVYTCNLNRGIYEVTARTDLPETSETVSWGQDASPDEFIGLYKVSIVRAILRNSMYTKLEHRNLRQSFKRFLVKLGK